MKVFLRVSSLDAVKAVGFIMALALVTGKQLNYKF